MMEHDEKNIKKLIQKIGPNKPSDEFTDKIMAEINTVEEILVPKDEALVQLLKRTMPEETSSNFTYKVMQKIDLSPAKVYKPLISKKGWAGIVVFFVLSILATLIFKPVSTNENPYVNIFLGLLEKASGNLFAAVTEGAHIPSLLVISISCLSVLLLLDGLLRAKRLS